MYIDFAFLRKPVNFTLLSSNCSLSKLQKIPIWISLSENISDSQQSNVDRKSISSWLFSFYPVFFFTSPAFTELPFVLMLNTNGIFLSFIVFQCCFLLRHCCLASNIKNKTYEQHPWKGMLGIYKNKIKLKQLYWSKGTHIFSFGGAEGGGAGNCSFIFIHLFSGNISVSFLNWGKNPCLSDLIEESSW